MRELAERRCVEAGKTDVHGIVAIGNDAGLESAISEGFAPIGIAVRKKIR